MLFSVASIYLLVATASARCSRDSLQKASDTYVAAQGSGKGLPNLGPVFIYAENDQAMDIQKGVLSQALKIDHDRSIHDTGQCATFTELIVTDPAHPYVIHTRILYDGGEKNDTEKNSTKSDVAITANASNATNSTLQINLIESVVTDPGDWAFNATGYLYWDSIEKWDAIAADRRDSREVVKAGGDAYYDRFDDASVTVPFGTPCDRLEGGAYTGARDLANNTCDIGGLPSTIKVLNRRYVVDEVAGVVDIFSGFPGLDRAAERQPVPDSHMFRIEGGKIRYIHTVSACFNDGCGMNGTGIPQKRGAWRRG